MRYFLKIFLLGISQYFTWYLSIYLCKIFCVVWFDTFHSISHYITRCLPLNYTKIFCVFLFMVFHNISHDVYPFIYEKYFVLYIVIYFTVFHSISLVNSTVLSDDLGSKHFNAQEWKRSTQRRLSTPMAVAHVSFGRCKKIAHATRKC